MNNIFMDIVIYDIDKFEDVGMFFYFYGVEVDFGVYCFYVILCWVF